MEHFYVQNRSFEQLNTDVSSTCIAIMDISDYWLNWTKMAAEKL